MRAPAHIDWRLVRGDSFDKELLWEYQGVGPIDLPGAGWTLRGRLKRRQEDLTWVDLQIDLTDATLGVVWVRLSDEVTRTLTPGLWYWDIERTKAGKKRTLLEGTLLVLEDITEESP